MTMQTYCPIGVLTTWFWILWKKLITQIRKKLRARYLKQSTNYLNVNRFNGKLLPEGRRLKYHSIRALIGVLVTLLACKQIFISIFLVQCRQYVLLCNMFLFHLQNREQGRLTTPLSWIRRVQRNRLEDNAEFPTQGLGRIVLMSLFFNSTDIDTLGKASHSFVNQGLLRWLQTCHMKFISCVN